MRIIEGTNVDLINPFPIGELGRTYGWNHCYRSLVESDDTPNTQEHFLQFMAQSLMSCPSWGIIDKNHITNQKHEAPLVGIIVFEPAVVPGTSIVRNGFFHIATARRAWKENLSEEAGRLAINEIFNEVPTLLRVSGYMVEKNYPARSLCKRLGFKYEGMCEDMFVRGGEPENMVLFGLTRRNYLCQNSSEGSLEPIQLPKQAPAIVVEPQTPAILVEDGTQISPQ